MIIQKHVNLSFSPPVLMSLSPIVVIIYVHAFCIIIILLYIVSTSLISAWAGKYGYGDKFGIATISQTRSTASISGYILCAYTYPYKCVCVHLCPGVYKVSMWIEIANNGTRMIEVLIIVLIMLQVKMIILVYTRKWPPWVQSITGWV